MRRHVAGESIEHADDCSQAIETSQSDGRVGVLPIEEEAHELGGAHRFDLGAQPIERVAVNPCQQRAVAPFGAGFCSGLFKSAAQHGALRFEREHRRFDFVLFDRQRLGESFRRCRSDERHAAANQLGDGVTARPRARGSRSGCGQRRIHVRAGMNDEQLGKPFCRHPEG